MEKEESPQKQFESASDYYFNILKNGFIESVESSTDKQYAHTYYKRVMFEYNEFIPHNTVFFRELKITFDHFFKLDHVLLFKFNRKYMRVVFLNRFIPLYSNYIQYLNSLLRICIFLILIVRKQMSI